MDLNVLTGPSREQLVKLTDVELPERAFSLRVINGQLWCCCAEHGIVVLDSELRQLYAIRILHSGLVCDVAATSDGDVVISTLRGLWVYNHGSMSLL